MINQGAVSENDEEVAGLTQEQELFAALKRLQTGAPKNCELALRAAKGKLRINFSNVAKEANCSRTLIAYKGCQYPLVREAVLQAISPSKENKESSRELIGRLRNEISELNDKLDERDTAYAELIIRTRAHDKGLLPDGRRIKTETKAERRKSLSVVG